MNRSLQSQRSLLPLTLLQLAFASRLPAQDVNSTPIADATFVAKPYVQLGQAMRLTGQEALTIVWQTPDVDARWQLQVKRAKDRDWISMDAPTMRRIAVSGIEPHRVYSGTARSLAPGEAFAYRVLKEDKPVFEATAQARKHADTPYQFVVFGDCAAGTEPQKQIAYQTHLLKPDFVLITGDIVYNRGRIAEYRQKYFPVYNAEQADPAIGAPLTRSTLFVGVPGNHDILHPDFDKFPDSLAYFYYWNQPLNGPVDKPRPHTVAPFVGPEADQKAFLEAAKENYPRMANFSFDYGNAHWTVLDSNPYVDWNDPQLREWVTKDLAAARKATWRFVAFHHPGFNSAKNHFNEQQMRVAADLFEKGNVDVVFSGHVHNYQRTYPLTFKVAKQGGEAQNGAQPASGRVEGEWTLDKTFDGAANTNPKGVLYLVTGGGGAGLYNPEQQNQPQTWQPFTCRFIADTNSLTCVAVKGKSLTVRQISAQGKELDRFTVTK